MNYLPNNQSETKPSKRNSITWKLLAIVFLMLIFLVPSSLVGNLIRERAQRQQNTIQEVSASWGRPQTIAGPVLVMPFEVIEDKDEPPVTEYAYLLPSILDVKGNVGVEMRSRGIYDVPVYETTITLKGVFPAIDGFTDFSILDSKFRLAESSVVIGLPDMRGITEQMTLVWNGKSFAFSPGVKGNGVIETGAHVQVPFAFSAGETPFTIEMKVRGSQALAFLPVGKKTTVALSSNWPHPSFSGAFLPTDHTITDSGFTANWQVLDLNRTFPDKWTSNDGYAFFLGSAEEIAYQREGERFFPFEPQPYPIDGKGTVPGRQVSDAFGVRLLEPVDLYQKTERSAKYAIAVIALVFVVILFTELTARRRIHPVQYALIGFALVVFYTLLLSLAEHIRFGWSYMIASAAVIGLITLFCRSIMQSASRALMAGGILTLFYGFVYVILQLTDYALLLGSIALFCIIAAIMVVSRRIDWYGIGQGE